MNSWNQNCIKVHVAEYLQRNRTKFFQKNTRQSIDGASYYQRNTELLDSYTGTLRLMYSTYSGVLPNEVPGQESVQYSLQNWLFILCNLCISQLSLVKPPFGMLLSPWAEAYVSKGSVVNRIMKAEFTPQFQQYL